MMRKWISSLLLVLSLNSCGFVDAVSDSKSNEEKVSIVKNFAGSLELPSGMTVLSGYEIVSKLIALFPKGVLVDNTTNPTCPWCGNRMVYFESLAHQRMLKMIAGGGSAEYVMDEDPFDMGLKIPHWENTRYVGPTNYPIPKPLYFTGYFTKEEVLRRFNGTKFYQSLQALSGVDRDSTSPLKSLKSRLLFEELCSDSNVQSAYNSIWAYQTGNNAVATEGNLSDGRTILFKEDADILMHGETMPVDPATKMAFIVARRAWNFPYKADSAEVQILKRVYEQSTPTEIKMNLCMSALLSQQFMIGNPGKADILNRVGLSLQGKRPTFAQIESYLGGSLKIRDFVKSIQSTKEYKRVIQSWIGRQLSLTPIESAYSSAFHKTDTGYDPTSFAYVTGNLHPAVFSQNIPVFYGGKQTHQEACAPPFITQADFDGSKFKSAGGLTPVMNAPFDPRSTAVIWEQFNPINGKFEVLAGYVLKPFINQYLQASGLTQAQVTAESLCSDYVADPRWLTCKGKISLNATGTSKKVISLSDIRAKGALVSNIYSTFFAMEGTALEGTPMDTADHLVGSESNGHSLRRVVRYSPSGRNDQFSTFQHHTSGKPIAACNSMMRLISTCSYRPPIAKPYLTQKFDFMMNFWVEKSKSYWDATVITPYVSQKWGGTNGEQNHAMAFTYANPEAIQNFRCGEISLQAGVASDSSVAYGYDPLPVYNSSIPVLNQIPSSWLNASATVPVSGIRTVSNDLMHTANAAYTGLANNRSLYKLLDDGMSQEPYLLIEDALNSRDIGKLVTANYSYVNKAQEYFYRNQFRRTGLRPANYSPPQSGDLSEVVKMEFSTMAPLLSNVSAQSSPLPVSTAITRPAAGILSMPAFLEDLHAASARTLSARYFLRFLCGQANVYNPQDDGADELHMGSFQNMPNATFTAADKTKVNYFVSNHLSSAGALRQDCMGCHRNLDPLGMALFKNYGSYTVNKALLSRTANEISASDADGPNAFYGKLAFGLRANPDLAATGVFLGDTVVGVAGVGAKLAESKRYYSCFVENAFKNMFGRMPTAIEVRKAVPRVVDSFYSSKDFNSMIEGLAEIQENLNGD